MRNFLGSRCHMGLRYDETYDEEFECFYVFVRRGSKIIEVREFETDKEAWNFIVTETSK